ncbi:MAG: hypothetical protein JJU13_07150 [Balneolaceae bacterium]|nr:hypothetical protein [Balneolaceae bacterium]
MKTSLRCFLILSILMVLNACGSGETSYTLVITPVPEEGGTVTPTEGEYESGRLVEIAATPNTHWVFDGWEGDYQGTDNPAQITMESDMDIAAIFIKRDYPLTIRIEGEGSVSERVVQEKTTDYPQGTVVELTAEPDENWNFSHWEGDLTGDENPAQITIDGDTEVTAVFELVEHPFALTIQGQGTVEADGEEITETTSFVHGSEIELVAIADDGWAFSEWTGDLESTQDTVQFTIDGPKEVTATFLQTYTLTTISIPEEGGEIEPEAGDYIRDTSFQVEAVANPGWRFVEWRGDFSGTSNPFNLTMNGHKTLEAHFERRQYDLELNTRGSGRIEPFLQSGTQVDTGDDALRYEFGAEVELVPVPTTDWTFVGWEGDISGNEYPIVVTMEDDISITAVFTIFDGGTGTPDDPYEVSTLSQLNEVRNHLDAHFILVNDINASATSTEEFDPIGTEQEGFSGVFDGDGFEISNLTISSPTQNNKGLFANIEEQGLLRNVTLTNMDITGDDFAGGLAGRNNGTIENTAVSGSVTGTTFLGGIVGLNTGTITRSQASVDVTGGSSAGGIVGWNRDDGEVSESYSTGNISGQDRLGGLVGRNEGSASILRSYALGNVTSDNPIPGRIGGLVGASTSSGLISETYAAGEVSGPGPNLGQDRGGIAGSNTTEIENSYWDTEATGQSDGVGDGTEDGTTGLTTAEMTGPEAEDNMTGFDWDDIWLTTPDSYPILWWQEE